MYVYITLIDEFNKILLWKKDKWSIPHVKLKFNTQNDIINNVTKSIKDAIGLDLQQILRESEAYDIFNIQYNDSLIFLFLIKVINLAKYIEHMRIAKSIEQINFVHVDKISDYNIDSISEKLLHKVLEHVRNSQKL